MYIASMQELRQTHPSTWENLEGDFIVNKTGIGSIGGIFGLS